MPGSKWNPSRGRRGRRSKLNLQMLRELLVLDGGLVRTFRAYRAKLRDLLLEADRGDGRGIFLHFKD